MIVEGWAESVIVANRIVMKVNTDFIVRSLYCQNGFDALNISMFLSLVKISKIMKNSKIIMAKMYSTEEGGVHLNLGTSYLLDTLTFFTSIFLYSSIS